MELRGGLHPVELVRPMKQGQDWALVLPPLGSQWLVAALVATLSIAVHAMPPVTVWPRDPVTPHPPFRGPPKIHQQRLRDVERAQKGPEHKGRK